MLYKRDGYLTIKIDSNTGSNEIGVGVDWVIGLASDAIFNFTIYATKPGIHTLITL